MPTPEDRDRDPVIRQPAPVIPGRDLAYLFQLKRNKLLNEIDNFKYAATADALGDYAELGFLATILQILMED